MSKPQLIICGSIAIDRIMNFSGRYQDLIHPDKLHALSLSVLLDKLEDSPGGTGANIAYNSALLGDQPILLGSVGPDAAGYIEQLSAAGINTEFVHVSQLSTASYNGMTDSDNNQVGGFYPGAMADSASLLLGRWAGQGIFFVLAAHDPIAMRAQVAECQKYELRLLYDPGQQVSNVSGGDLQAGVSAAEVLIVNDYELDALCKKTKSTPDSIKNSIPVVITTYGKDGSIIEGKQAKDPIKIAAAKPDQVVDPTGAGDAYRAGFLYGYLRQWELLVCGQLGSVLASFIVERHGTQHHVSKRAIMERYQENFNEELEL
jgi:adenosine kinase